MGGGGGLYLWVVVAGCACVLVVQGCFDGGWLYLWVVVGLQQWWVW